MQVEKVGKKNSVFPYISFIVFSLVKHLTQVMIMTFFVHQFNGLSNETTFVESEASVWI